MTESHRGRMKLSIILPVYNEKDFFPQVMDKLLKARFKNLDKEIIVIESNSTDGTKELVEAFRGRRGVKIVWEDRPRGKGHAVRNGLRQADGDIILIQDADLEYDVDDYGLLLAPLIEGGKKFVLGSRQPGRGSWRIRQFENQRFIEFVMNLSHRLLTAFFNLLYGQRLKDPTTMYKVFRRECLAGLELECNRFDWDWELLAKFVRRGIVPAEIPVRYKSRSFAQGKKIRIFYDPLTWIKAIMKYRLWKDTER
jgi:glycosyltransferase involved in cell wall biosynthesis